MATIIKKCKKCEKEEPHQLRRQRRKLANGMIKTYEYPQNCCNSCRAKYDTKYYKTETSRKTDREYYRNVVREKRASIKQMAIEYLGGKCNRCGIEDECVAIFDFHHRDPALKEGHVEAVLKRHWKDMILAKDITDELDKCELLCSNCHRKVHANYKCCRRKS